MMDTETGAANGTADIDSLLEQMNRATQAYCGQLQQWLTQQCRQTNATPGIQDTLASMQQDWVFKIWQDPASVINQQMQLWNSQVALWQYSMQRMLGNDCEPIITPEQSDKRFQDDEWRDNPVFDFIKQSYLLNAQFILGLAQSYESLDHRDKQQTEFMARQFVNALSPTNFAASNPEVLRKTMETGGANLIDGLAQLTSDLEQSREAFTMTMADATAFELGRNLATTPGKVVYQNRLMQLIQYQPSTTQAFERPLLIVPPWINKYYILDLREKNSFIRWLVAQGHTVFVISWVNPDVSLGDAGFADYMQQGPVDAIAQIQKITGEKSVNAIGYCIGGTLLACTQAWLTAKKKKWITTTTYLTTLLDFSDPGEIGVFINDAMVDAMDRHLDMTQIYDGRAMALSFSMLRENDLFWSFFVNNYLKGERPTAFDLLYWNADSTNLPGAMHKFYLRQMYLNNKLAEPNGIELDGIGIDLAKIKTPAFFLSAEKDHIAKWTSTYAGTKLSGGMNKFVLSGSGHIAGVINPPNVEKYGYWTNDQLPEHPHEWLDKAQQHKGSWWPHWQAWIADHTGKLIDARAPGADGQAVLEDAPGSYVKQRLIPTLLAPNNGS